MRRIPFAFLWRSPLRQRLWMVGVGMALFIATIAVVNQFIAEDRSLRGQDMGMDFIAFYTAGDFVREGRADELYNLESVRQHEQQIAAQWGQDLGNAFGPWWNPPFYAWVFAPLSLLSFAAAKWTWVAINVACIITALAMLVKMLGADDWRTWGLVPLLVLTSMACIASISHGQNTGTSLLILTTVAFLWRRAADGTGWFSFNKQALLAGLTAGLMFYKPQLAVVVAGIMTLHLGISALAGTAITGLVLLGITAFTLPGAVTDYLHKLPANVHYAQVLHEYMWDRHVTLKAFWRLMVQGLDAGEATLVVRGLYALTAGALGVTLCAIAWRTRRLVEGRTDGADRLIACTIAATPLMMPFYFDYDLLLLAIPAVLMARQVPGQAMVRTLAALAAWAYINAPMAAWSRVNGTVIALAVLSVLLLHRAWRQSVPMKQARSDEELPLLARAA